MPSPTQRRGGDRESQALEFLQARGLMAVERNYRCRLGEIDLIMRDDAALVFVEVRWRPSAAYGGAAASITSSKQAKLIRTAQMYLQRYGARPPRCRFDVVAIEGERVEWIKDAFGA